MGLKGGRQSPWTRGPVNGRRPRARTLTDPRVTFQVGDFLPRSSATRIPASTRITYTDAPSRSLAGSSEATTKADAVTTTSGCSRAACRVPCPHRVVSISRESERSINRSNSRDCYRPQKAIHQPVPDKEAGRVSSVEGDLLRRAGDTAAEKDHRGQRGVLRRVSLAGPH